MASTAIPQLIGVNVPASPELTTVILSSREDARLLARHRTRREIGRAAAHIIEDIIGGNTEGYASPVMWRSRIGNTAVQAAVRAHVAVAGYDIEFFEAPDYQAVQDGYTGPHSTYTAYRLRPSSIAEDDTDPHSKTPPSNVVALFPTSA
ncbi:MAG: hypothetical protein WBB39_02985 [Candidatus Saccharimonadales bacterium]